MSVSTAARWAFDTTYIQPISAAAQAAYATIYPNISGGFPQLPPSAFALKGGMTFAGLNGNNGSLYNTPKNVFMPRLGIAYQLNSKTVLRTGFGMFAGFLGERRGDVFQNGFTQNTNMILTNDNGLHFLTTLANPFPNGVAEAGWRGRRFADLPGTGLHVFQPEPQDPGHHALGSQPPASVQAVPDGGQLHRQQDQPHRDHAQHQHPAAAVSEHAADARRHLQQPADRQLREPAVQPGAGQQPGHLHRHHHLAADVAFALPRFWLQRHQHHREYRLCLVPQLPVHRLQALLQGLHDPGKLHAPRSGCRPSTC